MKLQTKTAMVIILTFTILIGLLYLFSVHTFLASFKKLETENVEKNLHRIAKAIRNEINNLKNTNEDWANWDDTCDFVNSHDVDIFIMNNLNTNSFAAIKVDFMMFVDTNNKIIYAKSFDMTANQFYENNKEMQKFLAKYKAQLDTNSQLSGITVFDNKIMLTVWRDILRSDRKGRSQGKLIFGRFVDQKLIDEFGGNLEIPIKIERIESDDEQEREIKNMNSDLIQGIKVIKDLKGDKIAKIELTLPRTIYQLGKQTIRYNMLLCIIVCILTCIIIIIFLRQIILRRLAKLIDKIGNITYSKKVDTQVLVEYNDEISDLSICFNKMLRSIEKHNQELIEARNEAETAILNRDHALENLTKAQAEAEIANRAKSAFLATMSHEIRTPMNGVIGISELILGTKLNEEQKEFAEMIKKSGEDLMVLINDILDFSKIESGQYVLDISTFSILDCIESCIDTIAPSVLEKKLEFNYFIEDNVPKQIDGDYYRIRQIIVNLLGNAVKFTSNGNIIMTISKVNDLIQFSIKDTGIGIETGVLPLLFKPFTQADGSTTRKYGGTGLGLSICRSLTELMGGTIWVESKFGYGSTFCFTIPYTQNDDIGAATTKYNNLVDKKILVVDDHEINRILLARILKNWKIVPSAAASGKEALIYIDQYANIDAVIIDMRMPEMNGEELAEKINSINKNLPIIVFTSDGKENIQRKELFSAIISKPLKHNILKENLNNIFQNINNAKKKNLEINEEQIVERDICVLLADDNILNARVTTYQLKRIGITNIDLVKNGLEAIEYFGNKVYDLILMDCQMPDMNGLDATKEIRKMIGGEKIKIIALTASASKEDREKCLEAGMDGYLSKPVKKEDLDQKIKDCLNK